MLPCSHLMKLTDYCLMSLHPAHTHSQLLSPVFTLPFVHKLWNGLHVALWDRGGPTDHLTSPALSCWTGKPTGAVLHPANFITGFLCLLNDTEPVTHHSTVATLTLEGDKPSRNILEDSYIMTCSTFNLYCFLSQCVSIKGSFGF